MTILATVNKGTFIYLQSLGKAFASTAISMVREVVFGVGFALLLPRFFGLNGVLYSMPVSDLLASKVLAVLCDFIADAVRRVVPLHLFQSLRHVGNQILQVLQAHGEAYKVGGHTGGLQFSVVHLPVSGGGGMEDTGLGVRHMGGDGGQLQPRHKPLRCSPAQTARCR